jgi:hypothetical protein
MLSEYLFTLAFNNILWLLAHKSDWLSSLTCICYSKDRDTDVANQVVRDTHVLYTKDSHSWNWQLISAILRVCWFFVWMHICVEFMVF